MEDCAPRLDDQGRTYLERVRTETKHMGQLIDDMLSLSRVGRAEMQQEPVDLTALARAIAVRFFAGLALFPVIAGTATCRVWDPTYLGNPPVETFVRSPEVPPGETLAFEQRVTALGAAK